MKIKNVKISGFHKISNSVDYPISDCNIICGKNGTGKTTIMQAIQWGLLGYIPGTSKIKGDIFKHANTNDMSVEVTFDDTSTVTRRMYQTDPKFDVISESNVKDDFDVLGHLELPILNFGEFIDMSANKLKEWFTAVLPEHVIQIDWDSEMKSVIPDHLNDDRINELISSIFEMVSFETSKDKSMTVDDVKCVNVAVKEHLKMYKSDLEGLESTIKTMTFYSDITSGFDLEEAKVRLDDIRNQINKGIGQESIIRQNEERKAEIEKITVTEDDVEKLVNKIDTLKKQLSESLSKGLDLKTKVENKTVEYDTLHDVLVGDGVCPYTKEVCDSIKSTLDDISVKCETLNNDISALEGDLKTERENYSNIDSEIKELEDKLSTISYDIKRKKSLESDIVEIKEDIIDHKALTEEFDKLQDDIIKAEANKRYEACISDFNIEKQRISYKIDIMKLWDKLTDVNGLQSKILIEGDQFDELSRTMDDTKIMSDNVKFEVGGKNKFAFGIIRGDKFIKYNQLSSGEKCLFTITLLISLLKLSDIPLKLILIDDMLDHLDTENFDTVVNYVANSEDVQVIFAGVFDNLNLSHDDINVIHIS